MPVRYASRALAIFLPLVAVGCSTWPYSHCRTWLPGQAAARAALEAVTRRTRLLVYTAP